MERFHSRDQRPNWFAETKDDFYIKREFNSRKNGLVYQYGRRFFVLEHQYVRYHLYPSSVFILQPPSAHTAPPWDQDASVAIGGHVMPGDVAPLKNALTPTVLSRSKR